MHNLICSADLCYTLLGKSTLGHSVCCNGC